MLYSLLLPLLPYPWRRRFYQWHAARQAKLRMRRRNARS